MTFNYRVVESLQGIGAMRISIRSAVKYLLRVIRVFERGNNDLDCCKMSCFFDSEDYDRGIGLGDRSIARYLLLRSIRLRLETYESIASSVHRC